MGRPTLNPIEKFWSRVEKGDGCWKWLGSFDKDGYGQIWDGAIKKNRRAHTFSAELHFGSIPNGKIVCHSCDNPSCANPDHLFFGTHADNCLDKILKNRQAKGESQGHSKLTEEQVKAIRERAQEGYRKLCDEFKLVPSTVYRIWHGQAWKHSHDKENICTN